jgi:hypothetical protein
MKKLGNSVLLTLLLLSVNFCSTKDVAPAGTSGAATINGTAFTATTTKTTDTGGGVQIVLADNTRKISIDLSDKVTSTYTVKNTSGRVAAGTDAFISALIDNVTYYGSSGNVAITIGGDGKLSGTFDAALKSATGTVLTISGGKISNSIIEAVPAGCKITSMTYTNTQQSGSCYSADSYKFYYNGDGKLSKAVNGASVFSFLYGLNGKLIGISATLSSAGATTLFAGANGTSTEEFTYSGTTLASYVVKLAYVSGTTSYNSTTAFTFNYSGNSISGATEMGLPGSGLNNVYTYTFVGGNISLVGGTYNVNGQTGPIFSSFTGYDTGKNPYALLAQLSGLPITPTSYFFLYGGIDDRFSLFSLNANNPINSSIGSFAYTYNAQNYPTHIVYTAGPCVSNIDIVYDGCQ